MAIADKLTQIANKVPLVYDAGYDKGYDDGISQGGDTTQAYNQGVEAGKQAEYDRFWDSYQDKGERKDYGYAFSRSGWNNETFKPKHPIIVKGDGSYMFDRCGLTDFDFVENEIALDTSGATSLTYMFRDCKGIKRIGKISTLGYKLGGDLNRLFYQCTDLETIEEFEVREDIVYESTFASTLKLKNLTIRGTIGENGFSVANSTELTHDSLMSIINALKDFTGTDETRTVTLGSTNLNKLTGTEKAIAEAKGWTLA